MFSDTEDEANVENDSNFEHDNSAYGNSAPEYETDPQTISMMGDVDAVANNIDQEGEVLDVEKGGQRAGIVKSSDVQARARSP